VEKRRSKRKPISCPAWLEGKLGRLLPCTMTNVSNDGAQLCVGANVALPRRFVLWLTQDGRLRRGCHVVWQKSNRLGVSFYALQKSVTVELN
jgi:hypothetical protein